METTPAVVTDGIRSLIDLRLVAASLTAEAPWCESHGADGEYLGAGLLYYTLVYLQRATIAVCLGSGGGFVPRLMRQAQRDLGIANQSRTILVDGNLPQAGWGAPQWLSTESFFRRNFPDVEIILKTTRAAAAELAAKGITIDYLHIDADHSLKGCTDDFFAYRSMLRPGSVVTLHDTSSPTPGAGVRYLVDRLRGRADCEVIDFPDQGAGTAVVRVTSGAAPEGASLSAGEGAVRVSRRVGAPLVDPPSVEWKYLQTEPFRLRNVLAAHFMRDCYTVIEIGGWRSPIDQFLTGTHRSVLVVDPFLRDSVRDQLNGAACEVRHLRSRFQDLTWEILQPHAYGLVILGLDISGLSDVDYAVLSNLLEFSTTTVIEFPTSWRPSREQYDRIRANARAHERLQLSIDLSRNDPGDLTSSWPPRFDREIHVLSGTA